MRRLALAGLIAVALLAIGGPAAAHDELVGATPADGSSAQHLPAYGTLTFSEDTSPAALDVRVGSTRLPVSAVPGSTHSLRYSLAGVAEHRTVVVTWTVVDEHDGHRSSGTVRLHLTGAATKTTTSSTAIDVPEEGDSRLLHWADIGSHVLSYLATVVLVGGVLFVALLWPEGAASPRARRLLATSVAVGLVAAVGAAGVTIWRSSDLSVREALATDYGRAPAALALLWLLASVVVAGLLQHGESAARGIAWRIGAVAVCVGLVRITGINAHATETSNGTLGALTDFTHLVAVSAWVGGLVMLSVCVLPRARSTELHRVVSRFSRLAMVAVATIVATGLLLLWDISRGIDDFWSTHYARVLVIKLSLFSVVILAAMRSKRWVETGLAAVVAAHRRTAARSLAVSVAAETVLVIAVLAAASVLVTSSPGR